MTCAYRLSLDKIAINGWTLFSRIVAVPRFVTAVPLSMNALQWKRSPVIAVRGGHDTNVSSAGGSTTSITTSSGVVLQNSANQLTRAQPTDAAKSAAQRPRMCNAKLKLEVLPIFWLDEVYTNQELRGGSERRENRRRLVDGASADITCWERTSLLRREHESVQRKLVSVAKTKSRKPPIHIGISQRTVLVKQRHATTRNNNISSRIRERIAAIAGSAAKSKLTKPSSPNRFSAPTKWMGNASRIQACLLNAIGNGSWSDPEPSRRQHKLHYHKLQGICTEIGAAFNAATCFISVADTSVELIVGNYGSMLQFSCFSRDIGIVPEDPIFRENPMPQAVKARFYFGIPIRVNGLAIGAVAVMDPQLRTGPPDPVAVQLMQQHADAMGARVAALLSVAAVPIVSRIMKRRL
ncbi:hypothetical protein FI667_g8920, partial [Globisporangium splendens]